MNSTTEVESLQEAPLAGKRVLLLGTLGGFTKRESHQLLKQAGARVQDAVSTQLQLIVIGNDSDAIDALLKEDASLNKSVGHGEVELLREAQLWELLSHREDTSVRQLYTPAMLAELLDVPVRTVRRWCRAGLIQPVKEVLNLPYFDYTELAAARQLAKWGREGATVQSIQKQLAALADLAPSAGRPIQQLAITAEGKQLLLRHGSTLVESTGQFRFSFEETADEPGDSHTISFEKLTSRGASKAIGTGATTLEDMLEQAMLAEDQDELDTAVDWYRSALAGFGPNADVNFQLAELLYRQGDPTAARERYYMALELNSGLVEARANLGCVLAECGQLELAVAAFEGTLQQFADYADVHFHLARALDDLGQTSKANQHWQRFIELAPASPWAEEAQHRLAQLSPALDL
ncbi:MAG: tetratricopeptide repeat protein [Pirellulaceae bacterium]|nr:tetratricopeptide repeat protein [Pirellulaceae bacterium]